MLKWLRANGCPWDSHTWYHAAKSDHEMVEWLRANGCPGSGVDSESESESESENEYSEYID